MSSSGWKKIEAPKRPKVTENKTWTGSYQAPFHAGGIAQSDRTYKRSMSVGRFTTTRTTFDDGSVKFRTTKTGRRHTHYAQDGTVHTSSHVPTSGSTIQEPVRGGATKTFD